MHRMFLIVIGWTQWRGLGRRSLPRSSFSGGMCRLRRHIPPENRVSWRACSPPNLPANADYVNPVTDKLEVPCCRNPELDEGQAKMRLCATPRRFIVLGRPQYLPAPLTNPGLKLSALGRGRVQA